LDLNRFDVSFVMKDNRQVPRAADGTPAERAGRDFSWNDFVSKKARLGPDLDQKDACSL
jgi:hypothetical protein